MPRVCTVCASPNRTAIDAALANGEGKRTIANCYSLSDSAVLRHRHACAKPVIQRRLRARDVRLEHLVDDLLDARDLARGRMHECIERDADADAARWSRELRDGNVVIGKLSGLYRESGPTARTRRSTSSRIGPVKRSKRSKRSWNPATKGPSCKRLRRQRPSRTTTMREMIDGSISLSSCETKRTGSVPKGKVCQTGV